MMLEHGFFEVTKKCQLRCKGCYILQQSSFSANEMSLEGAIGTLDLCKKYAGQDLKSVQFLGGDPLLWTHLRDFIKEATKRKIKLSMCTNMLKINKDLAKFLLDNRVKIKGKLDIVPDDTNLIGLQAELIGCNPDTAKRMIDKIPVFLDAGFKTPQFGVQQLVRLANINQINKVSDWCTKTGIAHYVEVMATGEIFNEHYWNVAPTSKQIANAINGNGLVKYVTKIIKRCRLCTKALYFSVDGNIRACPSSPHQLGHIKITDAISNALNSTLVCNRLSLDKSTIGEPCRSCDKWDRCRGGCRATPEANGGHFAGHPLCPVPHL